MATGAAYARNAEKDPALTTAFRPAFRGWG